MPASAHAKCSAVRCSGGENEACGRLRRQVLETAKGMTDADVEHMKELVKGAYNLALEFCLCRALAGGGQGGTGRVTNRLPLRGQLGGP